MNAKASEKKKRIGYTVRVDMANLNERFELKGSMVIVGSIRSAD